MKQRKTEGSGQANSQKINGFAAFFRADSTAKRNGKCFPSVVEHLVRGQVAKTFSWSVIQATFDVISLGLVQLIHRRFLG